jgi:anti-sigma factor RsiW
MDGRVERLINRHLDGELTDAEQAELNEHLLRDASARARLHDYQRIDAWCRQALEEVLPAASNGHELRGTARKAGVARRVTQRWLGLAAVAAAAALVLSVLLPPSSPRERPTAPPAATRSQANLARAASALPFDMTLQPQQMVFPAAAVSEGASTYRLRNRAVDVLGIYDTQRQEILLLQWDRSQDAATVASYEY